ncbi:MAG: hypothetical protein JSR58_00495 [Verrucomicrobia bacterium]|nr:hypothetical protein [Verrucomicrobiota bacterium]
MMKKIGFYIALASKLWSLNLSNTATLAELDPLHLPFNIQVHMNEKGDAAAVWANMTNASEGALESATKPFDSSWLSASTITTGNIGLCSIQSVMDKEGNIGVLWKTSCSSQSHYFSEKKWMHPWSKAEQISFNYNGYKFEKVVMDKDRNLLAISEVPWSKTSAVVLAFYDAKVQKTTYEEKGKGDVFSSSIDLWIDNRGVALAVWEKSHYKGGWFGSTDESGLEGAWHEDHQPWSMPEMLVYRKKDETVHHGVQIAIDAEKNATVIRTIGSGETRQLQALSFIKGKWLAPVDVASVSGRITDLNLSMDEKGNCLLIWHDNSKGIFQSAYKALGQEWSAVMEVTHNINVRFPRLAFDYRGNFVLVWGEGVEDTGCIAGAVFSAQTKSWTMPSRLTPENEMGFEANLAFSEAGKGVLVWSYAINVKNPQFNIHAAEIVLE